MGAAVIDNVINYILDTLLIPYRPLINLEMLCGNTLNPMSHIIVHLDSKENVKLVNFFFLNCTFTVMCQR